MPLLLIDCESKDGSAQHFERLSRERGLNFYFMTLPLRRHGVTLDHLFSALNADNILLVDSDVEIPCSEVIEEMTENLSCAATAYGSGYLHHGEWLDSQHGLPGHVGWYAERMWIPLVFLNRAKVVCELSRGGSFRNVRRFVEFPSWPQFSKFIGRRFWVPGLRNVRSERRMPAIIECDTGAVLHERLLQSGATFLETRKVPREKVNHFHGVTRAANRFIIRRWLSALGIFSTNENETAQSTVLAEVRRRLSKYGIEMPID